MKESINRTVTLKMSLSQVAKDFKYNLEVDSHEDVFHNGYSNKDVRNQDLNLPKGMDDLNKYFPSVVAQALEDAERSAYAEAIRKERISALEECLLKIDLSGGGAEYPDLDGQMVSAKAGITNVEVNESDDSIEVTILNPEHLINSVINGVGYIAPDLSSHEPAENSELIQRFHNLNDYFEVYGERKPSGELSSQYSPSINDEYFKEELEMRLSELSLEDVAQAVIDYVSFFDEEVNCKDFSKFVDFSAKEIKLTALKINQDNKTKIESKLK